MIQVTVKRLGVLLQAICRAVYCWMFLFMSYFILHTVYTNIRSMLHAHAVDKGSVVSSLIMATYAIVFDVTWWMFIRGKPVLKKWAIGANVICILIYFPAAVVYWNWRGFLIGELGL